MGEIADMMLDGDLCQGCGEYLGDGGGYARYCSGCRPEGFKRKSSTKQCNAPKCKAQIPKKNYACDEHWNALPGETRQKIVRGLRIKGIEINKDLTAAQHEARDFWKSLNNKTKTDLPREGGSEDL